MTKSTANQKTAQPHTVLWLHVYAVVLNTGGALCGSAARRNERIGIDFYGYHIIAVYFIHFARNRHCGRNGYFDRNAHVGRHGHFDQNDHFGRHGHFDRNIEEA